MVAGRLSINGRATALGTASRPMARTGVATGRPIASGNLSASRPGGVSAVLADPASVVVATSSLTRGGTTDSVLAHGGRGVREAAPSLGARAGLSRARAGIRGAGSVPASGLRPAKHRSSTSRPSPSISEGFEPASGSRTAPSSPSTGAPTSRVTSGDAGSYSHSHSISITHL